MEFDLGALALYGSAVADIGKYSSLMYGIYNVVQDNLNSSGVVTAGIVFMLYQRK